MNLDRINVKNIVAGQRTKEILFILTGTEWPLISLVLPSTNLPVLAPKIKAPTNEQEPPNKCTTPLPAKSYFNHNND